MRVRQGPFVWILIFCIRGFSMCNTHAVLLKGGNYLRKYSSHIFLYGRPYWKKNNEIGTICFEVRIPMKKVFWWKKASLSAHRQIRPLKNSLQSFWFFYDSRLAEQLLLLVFLKNFHFWLYIIENMFFSYFWINLIQ